MPSFEDSAGNKKLSEQLKHLLGALKLRPEIESLKGIAHGIEKESLRVDEHGRIALSPHPAGLGLLSVDLLPAVSLPYCIPCNPA